MLVYHDNCFLQVLEGPRIAVEAIYMRLKTDPRHRNVKLLLRCGISQTEFGDWSMAYVDTDGKNRGLKGYVDYLEQLDKEIVGDSQAMRVLDRFKKKVIGAIWCSKKWKTKAPKQHAPRNSPRFQ